MSELAQVLVIENGSQTTLRIPKVCSKHGVRAIVLPPKRAEKLLKSGYKPKLAILSGGLASVYDKDAPRIPKQLLKLEKRGTHLFGICYGMQLLVHELGGRVQSVPDAREYGKGKTHIYTQDGLFKGCRAIEDVWQSHGDTVTKLPPHFRASARSETGEIAAIENRSGTISGVQFHPEVVHTRSGSQMFQNLITRAKCEKDWLPSDMAKSTRDSICAEVGTARVIAGLSGGVDSTTLAKVASVLGKQLLCIILDFGQFREGEVEEAKRHAEAAGVHYKVVKEHRRALSALRNVTDGERLRKIFKKLYRRALLDEARKFGAKYILQGTLLPDLIESGKTGGALIKSHHNVGLVFRPLVQLHPFGNLLKYEVRELARKRGLPKSVWSRQPFPGPGLFLRIIGGAITAERLKIVRWADARVTEILKKYGWYSRISQLVVGLDCTKVTGVKGDGRCYEGFIIVRAVRTPDFLTAEGVCFPPKVMQEINAVLSQHRKIAYAVFATAHKPPGTTELR